MCPSSAPHGNLKIMCPYNKCSKLGEGTHLVMIPSHFEDETLDKSRKGNRKLPEVDKGREYVNKTNLDVDAKIIRVNK